MKKKAILITLLVLVAGAGAATWWAMAVSEQPAMPNTMAVARGSVEETVLATGVLEANALVSVGAQVSGIVEALHVELGDTVEAGEVIAEIDSLSQENAVKSAEAQLANIVAQKAAQEAALVQAQKALARGETLREHTLVSGADYETAEADVASAEAQLAALEAQREQAAINVEAAKLDLDRTTITAPIAGTVVAVVVEEGQAVSAAQSAPTIVKIADLDTMLIKAEISEADVIRVEPGQDVHFTILGDPDTKISATLLSIEPAPSSIAEESSTSDSSAAIYYNGILSVPNPDHKLRISMTAEVTIVLNQASDVLTVPSSAISKEPNGRQSVGVLDPQTRTVTRRPVTVGLDNKVTAEIVDGLSEGELVVTGTATAAPADSGQMGGPPGALMGMGGGMRVRL